jgi:S-DNA-T family DNA segregation ATPase FtsK/SpoIIIE
LIADPLIADPLDEIDASIEAEPRVTAKRSTTEPRVAEAIEEKKPAQKRSAKRSPIETPPRERDDELHPSGKTAEEIITDILTPTPDRAPTPEPDRDVDASPSDDPAPEEEQDLAAEPPAPADLTKHPRPKSPRVVDTTPAAEPEKAIKPEIIKVVPAINKGFRLPTPDMLEPPPGGRFVIDEQQLKATAQMLEKTLSDYGVNGRVEEIHPGPTVTTFEVSPAAGTKVSKVAGLADDLALGLSKKVRIVAPIPGKNRIGFEIPNEQRVPVNMRELVEDRRFLEMNAPLPCVLGRDIIGAPYFADLASMPHVIVAGATGAGKSVGLNVMLVSLLFRKTPEDLRLLMIDPKVVELAPFDRIPHMLLPVVTDMKQAANALKWAVDEMERRYQLFANAGTKNITTYNAWVEKVKRGEARPPKPPAKVSAVAADGTEVMVDAAKDGTDAALPEKLPFIVIVVDEFADLMMQQGKDVEASVARLAQKARAAGMHVILATQRPSVDVITGMIKANFPTRIAFRVAQKVDSRTILDEQGAEHLLGRGDMLVKMNGSNETRRVQCPFCSEEEVQRITDFLRLQGEPVYDEAILRPRDEEGQEQADTSDAEADPMYDAAVRIVADTRRCSTSWIQRKLGIGYNRAAKIVEAMEKHGLVGPANGAKDREVLISPI